MGGVGVRRAEGGLVLVDAAAEEPEDGLGEALSYVGAWAEAEAQDVLDDVDGDGVLFKGGEPEEGVEVPLAGVDGELVEKTLEVVGELVELEVEDGAGVEEHGHVVGEAVKSGLGLGDPGGLFGGGVEGLDGGRVAYQ